MLKLFIPREREPGETRVAATPETVKRLVAAKLEVAIEAGAGELSSFHDEAYVAAGGVIERDVARGLAGADLVLKLHPPRGEEELPKEGAALVSFLYPHQRVDLVRRMAERRITAFAVDLIPRISRAQPMDALSSQANIAGYKAVILAADRLGKFFPMLMTAAGTIKPARVVILGAGVAGLQAIATARRLGALVEVSDIRIAVKEQVESLGAKFIDVPIASDGGQDKGGYAKEATAEFKKAQEEALAKRIADADVVICTAQVPGRPAPKLLPAAMVARMRPCSVIVDLAADQGGNCELTRPGEVAVVNGVTIVGLRNVASLVPVHASDVYARNLLAFVKNVTRDGALNVDLSDEITAGCLVTRNGQVVHAPTAALLTTVAAK
jgi:proton-translocating NAD(P)+ transhydrogenase subunit alpha